MLYTSTFNSRLKQQIQYITLHVCLINCMINPIIKILIKVFSNKTKNSRMMVIVSTIDFNHPCIFSIYIGDSSVHSQESSSSDIEEEDETGMGMPVQYMYLSTYLSER